MTDGMFEIIGWTGAFFFSVCALPQAILAYKQGHSDGFSELFAWTWFGGEVCMMVYSAHLWNAPLFVNYVLNFVCLLVIMRYMYFPREGS